MEEVRENGEVQDPEKAETVAVENAELRAQMQAELEAIQIQLKERMLSMM